MKELKTLERTLETRLMMVRMGIMYNGFYRKPRGQICWRTRESKENRKVVACWLICYGFLLFLAIHTHTHLFHRLIKKGLCLTLLNHSFHIFFMLKQLNNSVQQQIHACVHAWCNICFSSRSYSRFVVHRLYAFL